MNKSNKLLQDAENNSLREFYNLVLNWIKDDDKILNLGSGLNFNFERVVDEKRKVSFTSVDILPAKKPPFIKEFIIQSVNIFVCKRNI